MIQAHLLASTGVKLLLLLLSSLLSSLTLFMVGSVLGGSRVLQAVECFVILLGDKPREIVQLQK
jgi:hypothetical protein